MKRIIAIAICLFFLAFGLLRLGVGGLMTGQEAGWWAMAGEFVEAQSDTQQFMDDRGTNLVGFTPLSYFAFIAFMGVTLALGAIGQLWRRNWGLVFIGVYLASHGFLFLNFATINPKIFILIGAIILTLILAWANRDPDPHTTPRRATA